MRKTVLIGALVYLSFSVQDAIPVWRGLAEAQAKPRPGESGPKAHEDLVSGKVLLLASADMLKDSFLQAAPAAEYQPDLLITTLVSFVLDERLPLLRGKGPDDALSPLSVETLRKFEDVVIVTHFLSARGEALGEKFEGDTRKILERFREQSAGKLKYRVIDPEKAAEEYAEERAEAYLRALEAGRMPEEPTPPMGLEDIFKGKKQPTMDPATMRRVREREVDAALRMMDPPRDREAAHRELLIRDWKAHYFQVLALEGIQPLAEYQDPGGQTRLFYSSFKISYLDRLPEVIPVYASPQVLEYEMDIGLLKLARKDKPIVAFFDSRKPQALGATRVSKSPPANPLLPFSQGQQLQPASEYGAFLSLLGDFFEVRDLDLSPGNSVEEFLLRIKEDRARDSQPAEGVPPKPQEVSAEDLKLISCLIVAQPDKPGTRQLYEINRLVSSGIPAVFLTSRYSIDLTPSGLRARMPLENLETGLDGIFRRWGVGLPGGLLASKQCGSLELEDPALGALMPPEATKRISGLELPVILAAGSDEIAQDSPLTQGVPALFFPAASGFQLIEKTLEENGITATSLVETPREAWSVNIPPPGEAGTLSVRDQKELMNPQQQPASKLPQRLSLAVLLAGKFPFTFEGAQIPEWTIVLQNQDRLKKLALIPEIDRWISQLSGPFNRPAAIQALVNLGPDAIPEILKALRDQRPAVSEGVAEALSQMGGEAVAALETLLESPDLKLRAAAISGLSHGEPLKESVIHAALELLGTSDALAGAIAVRILQRLGAKAVPALSDALNHPDTNVRTRAAMMLGRIGEPAFPALIAALEGKRSEVCAVAAQALGAMGPRAKPAVPALLEMVRDKVIDDDARRAGLQAFTRIGLEGKEVVSIYIEFLKDRGLRSAAVEALGGFGEDAVGPVILLLGSGDPEELHAAMEVITRLPWSRPEIVPALVEALGNKNRSIRLRALKVLQSRPQEAKPAVETLIRLLDTEADGEVRRAAADTFLAIGPHSPQAVPPLIQLLKSGETDLCPRVLGALQSLGPAAKEATRPILDLLSREPALTIQALVAIQAIGKEAVPVLRDALREEDKDLRLAAVSVLERLGTEGVPALRAALKDPDPGVRRQAVLALGRPEAREAVEDLIRAMTDENRELRQAAVEALARMGPEAREALPSLRKALDDQALRARALDALASLGPAAKDAAPDFLRLLGDADGEVRRKAIHALARVGPDAKDAVPTLIRMLDSPDERLRAAALDALASLGPASRDAVPALVRLLEEPASESRQKVIGALARIGPEAQEAVPSLIRLLDGQEPSLHVGCVRALVSIGPAAKAAIPSLLRALDRQDAVAREAAMAFQSMGSAASEAVPALLRKLVQHGKESPDRAGAYRQVIWSIGSGAVPALLEAFKSDNVEERRAAVSGLLGIRTAPPETASTPAIVEALTAALDDPDASVRVTAATSLSRRGSRTTEVVQVLKKCLKDDDSLARTEAALSLLEMGRERQGALDVLIESLKYDNLPTEKRVFYTLWKENQAMGALVQATQSANRSIRSKAALILADKRERSGMDRSLFPLIAEALYSDSKRTRSFAALWLVRFRILSELTLPVLVETLKDKDPEFRLEACAACAHLLRQGPLPETVLAALTALYKDADQSITARAIMTMAQSGVPLDGAMPVLLEMLHEREFLWGSSPSEVVKALATIGPNAKAAVPVLTQLLLESRDSALRSGIVSALASIGPPESGGDPEVARRATLLLLELLKRGADRVSLPDVLVALAAVRPVTEEAVQALGKCLGSPHEEMRAGAARALGKIGGEAKLALPALKQSLKDEKPVVRVEAANALLAMREDAERAIAALIEAMSYAVENLQDRVFSILGDHGAEFVPTLKAGLKDSRAVVRLSSAVALGALHPEDESLLPLLQEALDPGNQEARFWRASYLARGKARADLAVPVLVEALSNPKPHSRASAARFLAGYGALASPAVPILTEMLSSEMAASALIVIASIGPKAKGSVPVLLNLLQEPSAVVLWPGIVDALAKIGEGAKESLPALIQLLDVADWELRCNLIRILGAIGPPAKAAIPALEALERGDDKAIGALSKIALERIKNP